MANVYINGTLLLDGNLTVSEDVTVTSSGLVIPVSDEDTMKEFYSYRSNTYTTANGQGRAISSTTGNIYIQGLINGSSQGFGANEGPGCNSVLLASDGTSMPGYGASHAGLGYVSQDTLVIPAPIRSPYGHWETPVSLGSGSGYYDTTDWYNLGFQPEDTHGGGAVKLEAKSGTVQVDGTIIVNGDSAYNTGGGAGGSVWIIGWDVAGSGTISADGGMTRLAQNCGGGSGGYISLWYSQHNTFSGILSAAGGSTLSETNKAEDGKIYIKEVLPILEEKFTGHVLNTKWWDTTNAVDVNNDLTLTSQGNYSPYALSKYYVSGDNITASVDYIPEGTLTSNHTDFLLYADSLNWVGLSRRYGGLYGVSFANGVFSFSGIEVDYTNLSFRVVKRDSTFSFQYYDSTSTPQTIYSDVQPDLANKAFYVKLGLENPESEAFRVEIVRITALDYARGYFLTSEPMLDTTDVALNNIWGGSQYLGIDFTCEGARVRWDSPGLTGDLSSIIEAGDIFRVIYRGDSSLNDSTASFDNLKIEEGIITGAETTDSVLYVDSDFGSDSSSGEQLTPLKNFFVATAWSKRGGTIVLYDGTHNATEVIRKDLTIRGAEGGKPLVTSQYVLDSTGSGWEKTAISFFGCQGVVDNVEITGSETGIIVENGNFDISRTEIHDTTTGIKFVNCDPVIARNKLYNISGSAMEFTESRNPSIYSNVVYGSAVAVCATDTSGVVISSNTFDSRNTIGSTHIILDNSPGIVASNNLTYADVGLQASLDSSVVSYNNNYYQTATPYSRPPDASANDMSADPLYFFHLSHDFHLDSSSPNIGTGLLDYDTYLIDFDGASRLDKTVMHSDIGAFSYIDTAYPPGYAVTSAGDDFWNSGSIGSPYRTFDKAMLVADATIRIDGGHYDTFYLMLNPCFDGSNSVSLYVYTERIHHFVTYRTLSALDVTHGFVDLGFLVTSDDTSHVALNIIGGPSQTYGIDYVVEEGAIIWKGYQLDSFLLPGDVLRIVYDGLLQKRALNTLILHQHYSNIEFDRAIFVSPSGSDSTDLGGDGTNTGGTGSFELPYRTITTALANSSAGDNIVAIAGEYPLFKGVSDRVLVPAIDRTAVADVNSRRYIMDLFAQKDFRAFGATLYDAPLWDFSYSGSSYVTSGNGFLSLTYDGTNTARADSIFKVVNDFEVQAELRNALDPIKFMVTSPDNTVMVSFNDGSYAATVITGGKNYICQSTLSTFDSTYVPRLMTEYIAVTSTDIDSQYVPLSFIPEPGDCSNVALSIVGGISQDYGTDFYIEDSRIKWGDSDGLSELDPGDILRITYVDRNVSAPVQFSMSLIGQRFTIKAFDNGSWVVLNRRDMIGSYQGPWTVSFVMDTASDGIAHHCTYGRGFVSRLLTIGNSFTNTSSDRVLATSTERKNVVLYKGSLTSANAHNYNWNLVCSQMVYTGVNQSVIFNDALYAVGNMGYGTGKLIKTNTAFNAWEDVLGFYEGTDAIFSIVVHNSELYASTLSGKLIKMNATEDAWVSVADQFNAEILGVLLSYGGKLYAGTGYSAQLVRLNDAGNALQLVADTYDVDEALISSLAVYNGRIYATTFNWSPADALLRLNLAENAWELVATNYSAEIYWAASLTVFNGRLYSTVYGNLLKLNLAGNAWELVRPPFGGEIFILSLLVFNNKLYATTEGHAKLLRLNDAEQWEEICSQTFDQTLAYGIVFNNKIYATTEPNGLLLVY